MDGHSLGLSEKKTWEIVETEMILIKGLYTFYRAVGTLANVVMLTRDKSIILRTPYVLNNKVERVESCFTFWSRTQTDIAIEAIAIPLLVTSMARWARQ